MHSNHIFPITDLPRGLGLNFSVLFYQIVLNAFKMTPTMRHQVVPFSVSEKVKKQNCSFKVLFSYRFFVVTQHFRLLPNVGRVQDKNVFNGHIDFRLRSRNRSDAMGARSERRSIEQRSQKLFMFLDSTNIMDAKLTQIKAKQNVIK